MLSTEGQRLTCDYLLVTIPCVRYTNRIKKGPPCNHTYEFTHKGRRGIHLQSVRTQRRYNDFMDTPHFAMQPYGKKAKFTYRFEPVGRRPHIQQMHATAAKKGVSRIITIGKAAKQVANLVHGYLKEEPLFTANGRRLAFGELYLTQLKQQNATLVISLGYYETSTPTALPLSSTAVTPLPPSSPLSPPPPPMSIPHTAAQPLPASSPKALSLHTPQVPSSTPHRTSLPFSTVAVAATQHQSLLDDPAWSPYYTSDTHVTRDAYTATFGLLPATPSTTASATPAQSWAYSDDSVWAASSAVPQHDYSSIPRQMWAPGAPIEDPGLYAFDVASDPTPLTSTFFESWAPSSSSASTSQEADFGFFDPTGTVDETVLDLLAQANVGQPQNYHYHYYPFGS